MGSIIVATEKFNQHFMTLFFLKIERYVSTYFNERQEKSRDSTRQKQLSWTRLTVGMGIMNDLILERVVEGREATCTKKHLPYERERERETTTTFDRVSKLYPILPT